VKCLVFAGNVSGKHTTSVPSTIFTAAGHEFGPFNYVALCGLQMLKAAVRGHIQTFPEGIQSYQPLVEALELLHQQKLFSTAKAGQAASRLLAGTVSQEKQENMKRQLAKCSNDSSNSANSRRKWTLLSCIS
jgi:hypothetical protein